MEKIKFSIVIPVFLTHHLIERLLDSIDFYEDIEVIIIDDSPVTKTSKLESLISNYPYSIKILSNKRNMGVTYTRNKGYLYSNGDFVIFMDSDDTFIGGGIKNISDEINKYRAHLYLFRVCDCCGNLIGKKFKKTNIFNGPQSLSKNYGIGECLVVVKKISGVLPFISKLRGHELSGLTRFLLKTNNSKMIISNKIIRQYNKNNEHRLSNISNFRKRLHLISEGHFILSHYLLSLKEYRLSFIWLLKACIRRSQARFLRKK